ncbi:MAG: hypothetical protein ACTHNW_09455 [Mucilaginibacter sp.]
MKKLSISILVLSAIVISSCRHHHHHVTIVTHGNNFNMKLEYEGTMAFNNEGTKVEAISKDGYINYKRNSDEIHVAPDPSGYMRYEQNGAQVARLDNTGQNMLDEAIHMIVKSSR